MKPEFKKLRRYTVRCSICGKQTDCLAEDMEDAIKRFQERGWSFFDFHRENDQVIKAGVCKGYACKAQGKALMEISVGEPAKQESEEK